MLLLKQETGKAYEVRGYMADFTECMTADDLWSLEEAIATAQVEWCEGQYEAEIRDAETKQLAATVGQDGSVTLAVASGWQVEIA